jgi:hypothetical protein
MRPVIATGGVGPGAGGDLSQFGRATEFSHRHHQRFIEQSPLGEVFDQGRKRAVGVGEQRFFQ